MPLTDWARAASTLLPIKTLSSWKSHQPRSGGQWEYSQLDKIIKWSQTGARCEHYWSHQHHRHILLPSEQNMCHAATPSSNGKYSNCTFLQSFVRSSSSPSNGRCWLTIELFCQYIVKRLQICSNIKGSKLHTSFLTRLIRSTNFCPLSSIEALRTWFLETSSTIFGSFESKYLTWTYFVWIISSENREGS